MSWSYAVDITEWCESATCSAIRMATKENGIVGEANYLGNVGYIWKVK